MQRWSKLFIPTLREAPADAEVASHKFLVRAGYVRQLAAGIYSYLFLAQRTILKITGIVREEMDTIGQELYLPALNPREVWEASGRWSVMGDNMFRLKDRKGADLCLGMTHEEIMTDIARKELRSYKQLPQIWYQIQTKFRDEPRPKSGLLRVRQFTMKDSYSFDIDRAGLDKSFDLHDAAYRRIFRRCGLEFVAVEADSGSMGGSQSQEFMVYTDAGEDLVASCGKCGYAANLEKATSKLEPVEELAANASGAREKVHTPGTKTIDEVAAFLKVPVNNNMKSLAYVMTDPATDGAAPVARPLLVLMRGNDQMNEAKLSSAIGGRDFRPMVEEEIVKYFNSPAGYLGPVGLKQVKMVESKGIGLRGRGRPLRRRDGRSSARTQEPGERSQRTRSSLHRTERGHRLRGDRFCRSPQRGRGRRLSALRRADEAGQGRRDRAHLQARHQVRRLDGRKGSRQGRQGSHPHHGQLRHRRGAHPHLVHRAEPRRQRLLAGALDRSVYGGRGADQHEGRADQRRPGKRSPPSWKPPDTMCCSTTATNGPE